jgi:hypothetical protein
MNCPWCNVEFEIEKRNCGVFRCGVILVPHKTKPGIFRSIYLRHGKEESVLKWKNMPGSILIGCMRQFHVSSNMVIRKMIDNQKWPI